ncbi:recombinase family protein [Acidocella sp. KAb 2-4]|uniref:recombinase family protein n=1 Tax=Acidocella sp. KAb 2-4 TaxID=2885158 RepID=UPI001D07659A|nr:recombinase family protein [Acidocella sp. KAb 2-4]MCB5945194.1 recombinase family protein [Acidocella sp. KAb 2-4]
MRAAIYARFSSDNQRDASIEDQVRVCRELISRQGWREVEVFTDFAISGATDRRPGFLALQNAIKAGQIDAVVAEALDRVSRDQEHIARFYKLTDFSRIRFVTVAEGEISELHVGLKGTMNALLLKDLGQKTHRGLEGRVQAGKNPGGICYGYRPVRQLTAEGTLTTGDRAIDEAEAAIVRRIFRAYVGGQSAYAIARQLNAEKVPGPRDGSWSASLLLGNASRETGVLRNRLYAGVMVWNRQSYAKDPMTGKRISRPNPPEKWTFKPIPELQIIDAELWDAAQLILQAKREILKEQNADTEEVPTIGARLNRARRPAWALSGLVRCGLCGGAISVVGGQGQRLGCTAHHYRGKCDNPRSIPKAKLLARVLEGLKRYLLAPELVEKFVDAYCHEVKIANQERGARRAKLVAEQARLSRQVKSLVTTIKDTGGSRSLVNELQALEQRQDDLAAELAREETPEPLIELHPNLAAVYRRRVELLQEGLQNSEFAAAATEALRSLIDAIIIYPEEGRGQYRVELRGDLAAFMHLPDDGTDSGRKKAKARAVGGTGLLCSGSTDSLVAGARFELTTFRL